MDNRIALLSIIVEDVASVEKINTLLHDYAPYIIGRMGIPYREAGINLIAVAIDAPMDSINTLTGKLGRLPGVSAKATCSNVRRNTSCASKSSSDGSADELHSKVRKKTNA